MASEVQLVFGLDREVLDFISFQIDETIGGECHAAIGVALNGRLIAGAAYSNHIPGSDVTMSLASTSPRASTRTVIDAFFSYPFKTLFLPRVSCGVSRSNRRCRKLVEGLGFHLEGLKPRAGTDGEDLILYGLFPENLKHAGTRYESA